mmetsp:Transcript_63123/g.105079  ORF Transcript_63123/g.105079 Transcript_63123/m.105079 type:complete len:123 (+) Transcript_63123:846-1214(+)
MCVLTAACCSTDLFVVFGGSDPLPGGAPAHFFDGPGRMYAGGSGDKNGPNHFFLQWISFAPTVKHGSREGGRGGTTRTVVSHSKASLIPRLQQHAIAPHPCLALDEDDHCLWSLVAPTGYYT